MKKINYLLPLVTALCVLPGRADAQAMRPLLGRVLTLDETPAGNLRVRVEGQGEFTTFGNGEFNYQIVSSLGQVRLSLLDTALVVLYPPGGLVQIPKDASAVVTVIIGQPEKAAINELLAERFVRLENIVKKSGTRRVAVIDSLSDGVKEILRLLQLREEDLRRKIMAERDRAGVVPQIVTTVDKYILELQDLANAFVLWAEPIKNGNRGAVLSLNESIREYNEAHNALQINDMVFHNAIASTWPVPEAGEILRHLDAVYEEALDRIHSEIHTLNKTGLVELQMAFAEKFDKKKAGHAAGQIAALGKKIQKQLIKPLSRRRDRLVDSLRDRK